MITTREAVFERRQGTERDYLLWRLNRIYRDREDPGVPDYAAVREFGGWMEKTS